MDQVEEYDATYRRYAPVLALQLVALTGDRQEAEDVVQEAFARAWPRWSQVSRYDSPEAWVRTVAVRLATSRWRKARNTVLAWQRHGPPTDLPGMGEDTVVLVTALRRLPEAQRVAIILHHLLDLPVDQVAAELGVPPGTVKARLSRGRTALAAHLSTTPIEDVPHRA